MIDYVLFIRKDGMWVAAKVAPPAFSWQGDF
ncbi:hypothetical protein EDD76_10788 [Kineothrix alysoides]|uniref:Uncharacterized protein n=1 Tax=Kineothrix alysoides TaxID=1469948 RepID=A0A4R1QYB4_9FIRM|nr:hypothetical protein EDD76_10788 [Kineothrix alysoides]